MILPISLAARRDAVTTDRPQKDETTKGLPDASAASRACVSAPLRQISHSSHMTQTRSMTASTADVGDGIDAKKE